MLYIDIIDGAEDEADAKGLKLAKDLGISIEANFEKFTRKIWMLLKSLGLIMLKALWKNCLKIQILPY